MFDVGDLLSEINTFFNSKNWLLCS